MSALAHAAALATIIIWYSAAGSLDDLHAPSSFEFAVRSAIAVLIVLLVILLSIWIVSTFIYKLDDSHFGRRGAFLWIVVGVV